MWGRTKSHLWWSDEEQQEVIPCACLTRSDVTRSHVTFPLTCFPVFSPYFCFPYFFSHFFPYFFPPYFFFRTFFLVFFSVLFFPLLFFQYFFPVLISRTFSKVATFEMKSFKISVSCFSSTCRYSTVHVPWGISIQTSHIELPPEGLGVRKHDLKGPTINSFNLKEDWNVL